MPGEEYRTQKGELLVIEPGNEIEPSEIIPKNEFELREYLAGFIKNPARLSESGKAGEIVNITQDVLNPLIEKGGETGAGYRRCLEKIKGEFKDDFSLRDFLSALRGLVLYIH